MLSKASKPYNDNPSFETWSSNKDLTKSKKPGPQQKMNEVDEFGWAHIHQAASKGYYKSVEKFIKANEDQLEFETQDELHETPLMVAIRGGMDNIETINTIIDLGGNLAVMNRLNHGLVEISCLEGHADVLEFLMKLEKTELPVWKRLLKFCTSEVEEEAECAGKAISELTKPVNSDKLNPNWEPIYNAGGILILLNIIRGEAADGARQHALQTLINVIKEDQVKEQLINSDGLECLIHQLQSSRSAIVHLTCKLLATLCSQDRYAELAAQVGIIAALSKVLRNNSDIEVLIEAVIALGIVCESSKTRQTLFNSTPEAMGSLCGILQSTLSPDLLLLLCQCFSKITRRHEENQVSFYTSGGALHIILLCDIKNKDIQLAAVDTIHMVVESNRYTQKAFIKEGAVGPLISMLNKSKRQVVQEKAAGTLWALAGDDGEERRVMAATMGVPMLIEFLGSLSETLHFIGSEGLGVLAQGPHNKQDEICEANGVHPLVRLLKSDKEYLVLSAIRTIRHLCVSVGYLSHSANQQNVSQARGIKLLNALLALSKSELIQVESALTLSYIALGNQSIMDEIWEGGQHLQFNYIRVLKLLYSEDRIVRLLAGAALATFAYKNIQQQELIAAEGGIRFGCFIDFLKSDDEYFRCCAAFQVVVLSRITADEEQAVASAVGLKLIVDLLNDSSSMTIQAMAADSVARLAHTRSGVPQALVAIDTINALCDRMSSHNSQVRGCAAIAAAYLAVNHTAERQLLNRCRRDSFLIKCLIYYTDKHNLPERFTKEWQHYKKIGTLPPIRGERPALVSQQGHRVMPILNNQKSPYQHLKTKTHQTLLPMITPSHDANTSSTAKEQRIQADTVSTRKISMSALSRHSHTSDFTSVSRTKDGVSAHSQQDRSIEQQS